MAMLAKKAKGVALSPPTLRRKPIAEVVSQNSVSYKPLTSLIIPVANDNVVELSSHTDVSGSDKLTDDRKRLDAWLSSYASFNDGHAPERKAYLVDGSGCRTGKRVKVNLSIVTRLEPGDQWGNSSTTKSNYLRIEEASAKSRGKPYLRLVHSNDSARLITDAWTSALTQEKRVEGFVSNSRPPTLQEVFIEHYKRLDRGQYGGPTTMDLQGWSLCYEPGTFQSMDDISYYLNDWYLDYRLATVMLEPPPSAIVEVVSAPVVAVTDVKVRDESPVSTMLISNKYGHCEPGVPIGFIKAFERLSSKVVFNPIEAVKASSDELRYNAWLEDPDRERLKLKNARYDESGRYDVSWKNLINSRDDARYTNWLLQNDVHNRVPHPDIVVDMGRIHPNRLPAINSILKSYAYGRLSYPVFERAVLAIYLSSERMWDVDMIKALEKSLSVEEPITAQRQSATENPIDPLTDQQFVDADVIYVDGKGNAWIGRSQNDPCVAEIGQPSANDITFLTEEEVLADDLTEDKLVSLNASWEEPPPYKVTVGEIKLKDVNVSQNVIPINTAVKSHQFGDFKVVNGVLRPDHIEEVIMTVCTPGLDAMLEDMVFDHNLGMYRPISSMSIFDKGKDWLHKFI